MLNSKRIRSVETQNTNSLVKYLKANNVIEGAEGVTGPCPYLISGYCILRGERLSPKEIEKCRSFWRECPDRLKSETSSDNNSGKSITSIINSILQSL